MSAALRTVVVFVLTVLLVDVGRASENLYEVDIEVENRDPATTSQALTEAFGRVLVRVTGTRTTLDNPALAAPLANAETYLLQYSYLAEPRSQRPDQDAQGSGLYLNARFPPTQIETLLRGAGEALLPVNRPQTLVWLTVEQGVDRYVLVPQQSESELLRADLEYFAADRAIPISWPAYDLEDMVALPAEQILELDLNAAVQASRRYGAVSVVVGRLVGLASGEWIAEWRHALPDQMRWDQARAASEAEITQSIANAIAEGVAASFGVRADPSVASSVEIAVTNVTSFKAYRDAQKLLESLSSVQRVQVASVNGTQISFRVFGDAGVDAITQELGLIEQMSPDAPAGDELIYRWEPSR